MITSLAFHLPAGLLKTLNVYNLWNLIPLILPNIDNLCLVTLNQTQVWHKLAK